MSDRKIQKLPPDAIRMLQSGIVITDAVQCVLELVYNSIDAKATAIVIRIDLTNYKIQVTDNGQGISKADLTSVGEKFMTSKYECYYKNDGFTTYGFKGQALCSLLDVCKTLKIETKTQREKTNSIKVFENKMPLPVVAGVKGMDNGTTVTVIDFMWSMPVRRKRINEIFDLEEIKMQLKYLAIVHYKVSFTLRNDSKNTVLFQSQCAWNIWTSIKNVFGTSISKTLRKVNHIHKVYKVSGFVSRRLLTSNNIQLMYINKRLIARGMIHKVVVEILENYANKNESCSSNSSGELKKLKHTGNRVFILRITCPISCYELYTNMRKCTVEFKAWQDVLKTLQKGIKGAFYQNENISVDSQHCDKDVKQTQEDNRRRKHGTSLLISAIKGVPVKRQNKAKQSSKKPKEVEVPNQKKIRNVFGDKNRTNNSNNPVKEVTVDLAKDPDRHSKSIIDQTVDSLESPIPKKKLKGVKKDITIQDKFSQDQNESFLQFYKWFKGKIQKDSAVFKVYQTYLKSLDRFEASRANTSCKSIASDAIIPSKEICTSPKMKEAQHFVEFSQRKHLFLANKERPTERINDDFNVVNDIQKNLNNQNRHDPLGITSGNSICLSLPHTGLVAELNKTKITEPTEEQKMKSLNESYEFFSNYVKFRNFTDSFYYQSQPNDRQIPLNTTNLNTWTSHHHQSLLGHTTAQEQTDEIVKECVIVDKRPKSPEFEFDFRIGNSNQYELESPLTGCVELRPSFPKSPDISTNQLKKDAMIQVDLYNYCIVSESTQSKSFEDNRIIGECIPTSLSQETNSNEKMEGENLVPRNVLQLDFRHCSEVLSSPNFIEASVQKLTNNKPAKDQQKKDLIMSSEIGDSWSKEVIAGLWTNSLRRLKAAEENSSEVTKKSLKASEPYSTQLTSPIPIDDVDFSSLRIQTPMFKLTSRLDCMPKGLSPMLPKIKSTEIRRLNPGEKSEMQLAVDNSENEFLACVKWQDGISANTRKPVIPDRILDEMRQKAQKHLINCESSIPSASLSYCAIKVHNLLHSFAFTKELLSGVEVIGQLDRKFIVARMKVFVPKKKELITLFDQHAVDERIKLEQIIKDNTLDDGKILSASLGTSLECEVDESSVQILLSLKDAFSSIGLGWKTINEKTIVIEEIPSILADKYGKDIVNKNYTFLKKIIQNLIADAVNELTETRGYLSQVPKILYNLFCSEACHSAIRFNKSLTKKNMSDMVDKLKNCKLPFQCAHGRPSVIPIIDLEDFNSSMVSAALYSSQINQEKLKNFMGRKNKDNPFV